MNTCAVESRITRLLDDNVSADERDELESHLETCASCRHGLSAAAGALRLEDWRRARTPARVDPMFQRMVERLARLPTPSDLEHPASPRLTPAADPFPELPGYELMRVVGHGGMGVVYEARQLGLNRTVAIKLIAAGWTDAVVRERFRREVHALARVRHPGIVQIFDAAEHHGRPFLVMEWVDGGNLAELLSVGRPSPRESAVLVAALALALQSAHEQGIVHRDLKPSNVLLSLPTAGGPSTSRFLPKISDFGLVKLIEDDIDATASGLVLGTPSYMAPEQTGLIGDVAIGPTADVYGLGAIFYELLTGRRPFQGPSPLRTIVQSASEDVVSPRTFRRELAVDLETICLKCLEPKPSRRYATAAALADDLTRYLDGRPITARRSAATERAARWARRSPAAAALVGLSLVAALMLTAGIVFYLASMRDAVAHLRREQDKTRDALSAATEANRRTRDALDSLTGDVMDRLLRQRPQVSDEERKFLDKLRGIYEVLGRQYGDTREARMLRAQGWTRMGRLYFQIEARDAASDAFRKAVAEYERMRATPEVLDALVVTLIGLSDNEYARSYWPEGTAPLRQAVRLLEPVAAGNANRLKTLAHLEDKLAYGAANSGDIVDAEAHARRVLSHLDAALALQPNEPSHLAMLCNTHNNLSAAMIHQGRLDEAENHTRSLIARIDALRRHAAIPYPIRLTLIQAIGQLLDTLHRRQPAAPPESFDDWHHRYDAALADLDDSTPTHATDFPLHCEALMRAYALHVQFQWLDDAHALAQRACVCTARLAASCPTDALHALTHGRACLQLAEAQERRHAVNDARSAYEQAHAAVKPWFDHDTMSRDFRVVGAQAFVKLGLLLRATGHHEEARDKFQHVLTLALPDFQRPAQLDLARAYCDTGDRDAAEHTVARVVADAPDGGTLIEAAEVLSHCVAVAPRDPPEVRERRAARAVAWLQQAIQLGQPPPDPKHFPALQNRPDFQRLTHAP